MTPYHPSASPYVPSTMNYVARANPSNWHFIKIFADV